MIDTSNRTVYHLLLPNLHNIFVSDPPRVWGWCRQWRAGAGRRPRGWARRWCPARWRCKCLWSSWTRSLQCSLYSLRGGLGTLKILPNWTIMTGPLPGSGQQPPCVVRLFTIKLSPPPPSSQPFYKIPLCIQFHWQAYILFDCRLQWHWVELWKIKVVW